MLRLWSEEDSKERNCLPEKGCLLEKLETDAWA